MMERNIQLKKKHRISGFTIFNTVLLLIIAFIMLYPFWYVLVGSFMTTNESIKSTFNFIVNSPTLEAYSTFFASVNFGQHFLASVYAATVGTLLSLFFTMMAAYALSKKGLPGSGIIMRMVLISMLFNGGLIPTYMVVRAMGMINTWEALFIPGLINVFYMIIMRTYFRGLPDELGEAARIDGAGEFRILVQIILPISLPILATMALFYTVDRWNDLMSGIIYINDVNKQPLQAMLYRIINNQVAMSNRPISSSANALKVTSETAGYAATIITMVPILFVYPFLQKYFIHGMMIGSIKE